VHFGPKSDFLREITRLPFYCRLPTKCYKLVSSEWRVEIKMKQPIINCSDDNPLHCVFLVLCTLYIIRYSKKKIEYNLSEAGYSPILR
jgi:hypothetical protein